MKRILVPVGRWLLTVIVIGIAILIAISMWRRFETDPWTRDGHVRADVVRVASDVGGLVTQVLVQDNQPVRKGQLLLVVDSPRYAYALEQADAAIASARATLDLARKEARRDTALGDLVATETHEQNLAKVGVEGSNPFARSRNHRKINGFWGDWAKFSYYAPF